jgi:hypothetical protein
MYDFFFRIGRARDATQELVGVVVFLQPLEVQVCSSVSAVTCNKIQAIKVDPSTTLHTLHIMCMTETYNDCW